MLRIKTLWFYYFSKYYIFTNSSGPITHSISHVHMDTHHTLLTLTRLDTRTHKGYYTLTLSLTHFHSLFTHTRYIDSWHIYSTRMVVEKSLLYSRLSVTKQTDFGFLDKSIIVMLIQIFHQYQDTHCSPRVEQYSRNLVLIPNTPPQH